MIIQTVFCAHGEIEEGMPKLTAAKEHSSAFVIQSQVWLLFDTIWYKVRCCGSVPLSFRSLARKADRFHMLVANSSEIVPDNLPTAALLKPVSRHEWHGGTDRVLESVSVCRLGLAKLERVPERRFLASSSTSTLSGTASRGNVPPIRQPCR